MPHTVNRGFILVGAVARREAPRQPRRGVDAGPRARLHILIPVAGVGPPPEGPLHRPRRERTGEAPDVDGAVATGRDAGAPPLLLRALVAALPCSGPVVAGADQRARRGAGDGGAAPRDAVLRLVRDDGPAAFTVRDVGDRLVMGGTGMGVVEDR